MCQKEPGVGPSLTYWRFHRVGALLTNCPSVCWPAIKSRRLNEYLPRVTSKPNEPISQSVNRTGTALTGRGPDRHNLWAAIRKWTWQVWF
jgi:hypothetical protein